MALPQESLKGSGQRACNTGLPKNRKIDLLKNGKS